MPLCGVAEMVCLGLGLGLGLGSKSANPRELYHRVAFATYFSPRKNNNMPGADDTKRQAARETIDILHEISTLLNTHLDRHSLSLCVSLIENGVNPEALADVIRDLRRQNDKGQVASVGGEA
ncbi:hypothetical protein EV356DRAFT_217346 [Viridothelium virens]|uniref:Mitotic-spindle organizing protein 1 n=1 Tax=Viridothelium virens TaxID=1048519 RepID=A0A6A6H5B6_VIRVR|nr:hypothetical protein EV356DRAFT_217346 [Viridothelium virens]